MFLLAQFPQNPQAPAGALIGGMLCGLVIGVAIGTLIAAVILRAACWLYNKMAGGPDSPSAVPEPDFGKAALIAFVSMLVNFGVGFVLGLIGAAAQLGQVGVSLISIPLSFITAAAMISAMLPTTFVRGLLVALVQFLIIIAIYASLALLAAIFIVGAMHH